VGAALAAGDTRRAWCPRACPAATDGAIEESISSAECCKDGNSERLINPAFRFLGGATGAGAGVIVTLRFHPAKVEFVYGNRGFTFLRLRRRVLGSDFISESCPCSRRTYVLHAGAGG